jgi:hypothetical protein
MRLCAVAALFCVAFGQTAIPAQAAACLTASSVDQGVVFNRKDNRGGTVIRRDGRIHIDYSTRSGTWTDERETLFGVFELTQTFYWSDEQLIGDGDTVITQKFRGKLPEPTAGKGWSGTVQSHDISYNSSEIGYQESNDRMKATFVFLPENNVELSGCTYRVIPVEAAFAYERGGFNRRWLYFPDLGFGLETKQGNTGNGLTVLKPM